jgi:membrane protein implicated in regulation of membrane protease activity
MSGYWLWWIAAAVLVGAELVTGTFYLLAIGIAAAVGGVAAWFGAMLPMQFVIAGAVGVVLTTAAHRWRTRYPSAMPQPQNSLDVGQAVHVQSWNADGSARFTPLGTYWYGKLSSPETPLAETLYIVGTRGSTLVLSDRPPPR